MIFNACESGWLRSRLAASRPSQTRATMAGRQCRVREKTGAAKTFHRVFVVRLAQAFHQADRVDQEGTDDRRIQALVVEHQHRFVEARPRVHDEAAGTGFRTLLAEVRGDEAGTVHQRHVQVGEGRHRAAAAVRRQAGDGGPFEEEVEQFGTGEDPRHQFAVLQVVMREGRLVLGEHAIDLVHPLVWIVDRLAFAEQGPGDVLQAERGETPGRRAQRLDAIDDQAAGRRGEKVVVAAAVLAPAHFVAATPQAQRHLQALGMLMQDAQVELHQVPADDGVGIVLGQPLVETFQQPGTAVAIVEAEIHGRGIAVGRAEHVYLALAAAFQGDGVEIAAGVGLDVQRHQAQARAIVRSRLQAPGEQAAVSLDTRLQADRRGDEALHQVALRRPDIGLEHLDAGLAQAFLQIHQLAMLLAVQAEHRPLLEVAQRQRPQLGASLPGEQGLDAPALLGEDERHRRLRRQPHLPRALLGRQPERDFRAGRRIAPVPGQDEPLQ